MKWIIAAILLFIGGYTYLTLHYRKPTKPYEPYHDMANRANTGRLLAAGYQRIELAANVPSDGQPAANTTEPAAGGLPSELSATLVLQPLLPATIVDANAAAAAAVHTPYVIQFRCATADDKQQFVGAELYVKGDDIAITPRFERLAGGLQSRTPYHRVVLTVPADALKPGKYHVTLIGAQGSRAWNLQVR